MDPNNLQGQEIHDTSYCNLQQQLRAAVQSLQWTYAIFWRLSNQEKLLVWNNGFYNGGIETRKTVSPEELRPEELSLQRTNQLRELYNKLSSCEESNHSVHHPQAALSPEDLTDAEWFYLLCMSFTFPPGSGLPGQAASRRNYLWLCNANEADGRLFKRALLAKTATIQTVICIPLAEGVLELGTTEFVHQDPSLIEQVRSFFAEQCMPVCSEQSTSNPYTEEVKKHRLEDRLVSTQDSKYSEGFVIDEQRFDQQGETQVNDPMLVVETSEKDWTSSLRESTSNYGPELQLLDQAALSRRKNLHTTVVPDRGKEQRFFSAGPVPNLDTKNSMLLLQTSNPSQALYVDRVPQSTVTAEPYVRTLPFSKQRILHTEEAIENKARDETFEINIQEKSTSAFFKWTRDKSSQVQESIRTNQQPMLKRLILYATHLHGYRKILVPHLRREAANIERAAAHKILLDETGVSHVLAERRRREKLNERFSVSRDLVPFMTEADKASIWDAKEYVKVEQLEEEKGKVDEVGRKRNRRKGKGGGEEEMVLVMLEEDATIIIEVKCEASKDLLLELLHALNQLHLHVHSCSSSSASHGSFHSTLRAHQSPNVDLVEVEEALRRVVAGSVHRKG